MGNNTDDTYPQKFLRGISSVNFVEEGVVLQDAFSFGSPRSDGLQEMSITWYDNDEALQTVLNQQKDGIFQFKVGVVEINRIEMRHQMKSHFESKRLSYERRRTEGNPYHGNLLLASNTSKTLRRHICQGLASLADDNIIYRSEESKNNCH